MPQMVVILLGINLISIVFSVCICRETGLSHVAVMKTDTLYEVLRYNSTFCCCWLRSHLSLCLYETYLQRATWFSW